MFLREILLCGLLVPPAVQLWEGNLSDSDTGAYRGISIIHLWPAERVLYGWTEG